MYGFQVAPSSFGPRGVIASPEFSEKGNVILRVGRENAHGWEQTEHVVLTPREAIELIGAIQVTMHVIAARRITTIEKERA